jgi:hypothetical protein
MSVDHENVRYVSDHEAQEVLDMSDEPVEYKLPPYPTPFRDWTDGDVRYKGDLEDYRERINCKLYSIWCLWAQLRTNTNLEKLLSREEEDKESDAYAAKSVIIDVMDALAKRLCDTSLLDEISWLILSEAEFEKRKQLIKEQEKEENNKSKTTKKKKQ